MTRKTIKLNEFKSPIPILVCKTQDGNEFLAMLDTGSEITIFDNRLSNYLKKEECRACGVLIQSIHQEEEKNDSSIYKFDFSIIDGDKTKHKLSLKGIVSDLTPISEFMKESYGWKGDMMVVIGSDTMRSLEWLIDFENNQITI